MSKRTSTLVVRAALIAVPLAILVAAGCDDGAEPDPGTGTPTATPTATGGSGGGICLLNNCTANEHCAGCSDGRNTCLVAEQRCVACDPNMPIGQQGCPEGEECSPYGICVPLGLTCPTDAEGEPTVVCNANADCKACSPMHQVCDTVTHKCQACTDTNTQHCLQSDICIDGKCSPKCPPTCQTDNDCMHCGGPGNEAHACNKHKCAQCSDTWPCPAGQQCENGVCVPPCGKPGAVAGTCEENEDCHYCGGEENWGTFTCKTPINNPDHGTCIPPFNGCSDIAPGLLLPDPWGDYSQTCSNDGDCNGVGILYDVGEQIRDLVGGDELDLGFTSIHICNMGENTGAAIQYNMNVCASIEVINEKDCGICVPCREDPDCDPISIDPLIVGIFCNDALATIAGALLIDLLWGDNDEHNLNFFCQPIAAGYGICIPCGNPMAPCGSGGGGGGSGNCNHQVDEVGDALDPSCNDCTATVCNEDPYCCNTEWDQQCVNEAATLCGSGCAHDECTVGAALQPSCSPCAEAICNLDPYCCNTEWDSLCVDAVTDPGHPTACDSACTGCAHSECVEGDPLIESCSPCATAVCAQDDYCCIYDWDDICVTIAEGESACSC